MKVTNDLVDEHIEIRDWILGDRNKHYWVQQDDIRGEDGLWLEVMKVKNVLAICVSVVVVLVLIIVVSWMGHWY